MCTVGGIGYLPARGTLASLAAIPLIGLFSYCCGMTAYKNVCIPVLLVIANRLITVYMQDSTEKDPQEIVLDEVVGMFIALSGFAFTVPHVIVGFCLFRFFDILKPWPISAIEKMPGASGILMDDVIAGAFARSIMMIAIYYGYL